MSINHIGLYRAKWVQEAFLNGPIWELYSHKKDRKNVSVFCGQGEKRASGLSPLVLLGGTEDVGKERKK